MDLGNIKNGISVRTSSTLGDTRGMMVNPSHLNRRRPDTTGIIAGYVPGHGGDVWWVEHGPNDVAPYVFNEFEPA